MTTLSEGARLRTLKEMARVKNNVRIHAESVEEVWETATPEQLKCVFRVIESARPREVEKRTVDVVVYNGRLAVVLKVVFSDGARLRVHPDGRWKLYKGDD